MFDLNDNRMRIDHIELDKTNNTMYVSVVDTTSMSSIATLSIEFKQKYPSRWHSVITIMWATEKMNTLIRNALKTKATAITTSIMNDVTDEYGFIESFCYG